MNFMVIVLLYTFCVPSLARNYVKQYLKERNHLIDCHNENSLGSDIILNKDELKVNEIIMKLKHEIIDDGFANPQYFNFSKHFFTYNEEVKSSTLYQILKSMPKGAFLHGHDTGLLHPDYILNITYWDNLWVCFAGDNVEFLFAREAPISNCGGTWELMNNARYSSEDVDKFDAKLRQHFTMVIDNPTEVYTDINTIWAAFQQYFIVTTPLLSYKPAWEYYLYNTLKEYRLDNLMYMEIRTVLTPLYDLDGNIYDPIQTTRIYKETVDRFIENYPDFFGLKIIYAPMRGVNVDTLEEYIEIAKQIKKVFPSFFAGFDLVGQEDLGEPLITFLPQLIKASSEFPLFFHAGETNWFGTTTDENLLDAILLGSRRIGHAYALSKYPGLIKEIKKRDIAIEANVISNAVLGLVSDVRNHPLATFLSSGLPVVLSSDDAGVWGADPITHDYFVTFLGVASKHSDLRLLKKLAINSLVYSTVPKRSKVLKEFEKRWNHFIQNILNCYSSLL